MKIIISILGHYKVRLEIDKISILMLLVNVFSTWICEIIHEILPCIIQIHLTLLLLIHFLSVIVDNEDVADRRVMFTLIIQ